MVNVHIVDPSASTTSMDSPVCKGSPRTSRILAIPCDACGDSSSGKHYGIYACDGCAGFFKRSIRKQLQDPRFSYTCSMRNGPKKKCFFSKEKRNDCKYCRFQRCLDAGMNKDSVQQERGARKPKLPYVQYPVPLVPSAQPLAPVPINWDALRTIYPAIYVSSSLFTPNLMSLAASLQSLNMEWACELPEFRTLPPTDKLILMTQCWPENFMVAFAVYCSSFLPTFDIKTFIKNCPNLNPTHRENLFFQHELNTLMMVFQQLKSTHISRPEMDMMRSISLFNPAIRRRSPCVSALFAEEIKLENYHSIAETHKKSCEELVSFENRVHVKSTRAKVLLNLLEHLHVINGSFVELLFFKSIIGLASMDDVVREMLQRKFYALTQ